MRKTIPMRGGDTASSIDDDDIGVEATTRAADEVAQASTSFTTFAFLAATCSCEKLSYQPHLYNQLPPLFCHCLHYYFYLIDIILVIIIKLCLVNRSHPKINRYLFLFDLI